MTRPQLLTHLRTAGYHGDSQAFTRLLIENRITTQKARRAWREGQAVRANGVRCDCADCTSNGGTTPCT